MGTVRRIIAAAIEPNVVLSVLTTVSCLGAIVYLALVIFTPAVMTPLYFGLIVLMCAIGAASLYILRANQDVAIITYAWLASICLASMMTHDAIRGERFDHLLWVYQVGIVYIIICVGVEQAFLYALGVSFLGAILGLCEDRFFDGVFYALMPLAVWLIGAAVSGVIRCLQRRVDDITELLETWESAERGD